MSPLNTVFLVAAVVAALCWLLSLATGDTSWVDRIWSIIPAVYVWIFAGYAHFADTRLNVMVALTTLWGARLTFNFARKGGYSGMEDYRWEILRRGMRKWQFQLFNFFFIAAYQNLLLLLIALPAYTAYKHQGSFSSWDIVFTVLFILFLIGETIADQQQWNFQENKRKEREAGRQVTPGFLQTGLFTYSRHPNFFCELSQWWVIYLFGAVAAGTPAIWTIIGVVLLTILFVGSTRFTEEISSSKYPEYADYQRRTSAVIPWFKRA